MRALEAKPAKSMVSRVKTFTTAFNRDERGFTAVEFAMVAMPFLMLLFGTIAVGLYFFTTFTLENAVEKAARQLRTGQAQMAGKTTSEFKDDVCSYAPGYVDCAGNLRVNVTSFSNFGAVTTPPCVDSAGDLVPDATSTAVPGAANEVVLVTVCYEWELAGALPFLELGDMNNGSAMIRASTTFKTEPYN
jgi:Flp pilus assembly protein TadG